MLGMVVIRAHPLMVEEREQFAPVATQAFDEAFGIGIFEGLRDEFVKALMEFCLAPCVDWCRMFLPPVAQAHCILE